MGQNARRATPERLEYGGSLHGLALWLGIRQFGALIRLMG
jgi:hypothetical protein